MNQPPAPAPGSGARPQRAPDPDRYLCPEKACKRWPAEHMRTGLLARHRAPGGDPFTLCPGSLAPVKGLPRQAGRSVNSPLTNGPYQQPTLFG